MASQPHTIDPFSSENTGEVKKTYVAGATFGLKEVTYTERNGDALFEGDILLGTDEEMQAVRRHIEDQSVVEAVAISGQSNRWPGGTLIYRIDAGLPNQSRVTDAIQAIRSNTNLTFRVRTTEANFVTFRNSDSCSSAVGMRGGEQFVNLGPGCSTGNAIHEICHAAGLWHEQSREDRDSFVVVNWSNIVPALRHNFDQHVTDGDDVGRYDYDSIMHYPRNAFAINTAVDTLTPIPNNGQAIGQRAGLSAGDIRAINMLYPQKAIHADTSTNGLALTTRGNTVLMGWTGSGNLRLNFMTSADGLTFGNKVTLNDVSPAALALAVFNNQFIVAWIGVGNNQLNIMKSGDGQHWGNKVTLGDTSQSAPELAVFNGQLYITWRGVGNNQLNVMRSADGVHFGNKVTLGDTTTSGPTLAVLGNQLLLGWRGVGNNQLNVMRSADGIHFGNKVTLGDTTTAKPFLFTRGNQAYLTWQGVNNALLNILVSPNGANWGSKFTSNETCIDGPVITDLPNFNRLVWGWTGTDAAHHLNTLLFNW
jgi:Astacin (Peptidase family M12A)